MNFRIKLKKKLIIFREFLNFNNNLLIYFKQNILNSKMKQIFNYYKNLLNAFKLLKMLLLVISIKIHFFKKKHTNKILLIKKMKFAKSFNTYCQTHKYYYKILKLIYVKQITNQNLIKILKILGILINLHKKNIIII